jgi:hypothetical protein
MTEDKLIKEIIESIEKLELINNASQEIKSLIIRAKLELWKHNKNYNQLCRCNQRLKVVLSEIN